MMQNPFLARRDLLDLFPEPLAIALERMIVPLQSALESYGPGGARGDGEFDGYDGLTRRGPYERLLASEWLLVDELPDEFLRRAVTAEHAFLQPAHRQPFAADVCAALFDAGPDQLGAPRLAQLAALLLFSKRAFDARRRFEWGIVQHPVVPYTDVNASTIGALLGGRTREIATEDALRAWRSVWPAERTDLWLVGGRRLGALPSTRSLCSITVEQPFGSADLVARAQRSSASTSREARLPLPSPDDCVRLLRDPFRVPQSSALEADQTRQAPSGDLCFLDDGSGLAGRGAGNDVLLYAVPASIGEPQPAALRVVPPERPLAVAALRRNLVMVTGSDRTGLSAPPAGWVKVHVYGRDADLFPDEACPLPDGMEIPETLGSCSYVLGPRHAPYILLAIGETLLRIAPREPTASRVTVEARGVQAVLYAHQEVAFVQRQASGAHALIVLDHRGRRCVRTMQFDGACTLGTGLLALQRSEDRWDLVHRDPQRQGGSVSVAVPPSAQILGAQTVESSPVLVSLAADRRTFSLHSVHETRIVHVSPRDVNDALLNPFRAQLVYLTDELIMAAPVGPQSIWACRSLSQR